MKKITILLSMLFVFTLVHAVPSDTIYNDVKTLLKDDLKGVVAYSAEKGEQGVKYLFTKADTIVSKAYTAVTKGTVHTYEILKTQQFVKSLHHLFYFIIGIILTFVLYNKIKKYINDNSDANFYILLLTLTFYGVSIIYNTMNFNEMLTGFINPEYGAIKEVIEFINQNNTH